MSKTQENYIVEYLREIKDKRHRELTSRQDSNILPFQELLNRLEIDGLIAHSSIKQLVSLYQMIYEETNALPELCEVELYLLRKAVEVDELKKTYIQNQKVIQNNSQALLRVKDKIQQVEKIIEKEEKSTAKQKLSIQEFKNEGLRLVLSQNRRMEFQLEKADHELDIDDLTEEELLAAIAKTKSGIQSLKQTHTGSHQFPMTKTDATLLLNQLDLQYQRNLLK